MVVIDVIEVKTRTDACGDTWSSFFNLLEAVSLSSRGSSVKAQDETWIRTTGDWRHL